MEELERYEWPVLTKMDRHYTVGPHFINRKVRRQIEAEVMKNNQHRIAEARRDQKESVEERRKRLAAERRIRLDAKQARREYYSHV